MNRHCILNTCAMTALGLVLTIGHAAGQSVRDLVGTWTLVSAEAFGPSPKGSIMFDANGHFSAIFVRNDLAKYRSNNCAQGVPTEYKAASDGSLAFFGTYAVSGPIAAVLDLHIEGSTFPDWAGTDQKRIGVTVAGDELKYTQPSLRAGDPAAVVVWKRAR